MKLIVNKDICVIDEQQNEIWNVGDYNVHQVEVELSDDFDGLINKVRYFVLDEKYDMNVIDGIAQVPYEATQYNEIIKIGVYGYKLENEEQILVQSTIPVEKYIHSGTYKGEANNSVPLTPTDKQQIETEIQNLKDSKQDILISGTNIKTINGESILGKGNLDIQGGGTEDYEELEHLPSINNVQLKGNKTSSDLGLQPAGDYALKNEIPTALSDLTEDTTHRTVTDTEKATWDNKADISDIPDVSNFITNTVDNLVNYYKKSETYTQAEVNSLIGAISTMTIQVVQTLPTQDISTTTIYLVPSQTSETQNVYDEYIYVSNNWEKIGSTDIDLSNYYTKSQVDNLVLPIGIWNTQTQGTNISDVIGNWQEINATYEDYDTDIEQDTYTVTVPKYIVSVDYLEANGEEVSPSDYTFSGKTITFNTLLEAGSYVYVGYYGVPPSLASVIGNWSSVYLENTITDITKSIDDKIGNWNTLSNGSSVTNAIGAWRSKYSTTSIKDKMVSVDTELNNRYTKTQVDNLIPTVGNGIITFYQGAYYKGSLNVNQSNNAEIYLDTGDTLPSQTGKSGKFLTTNGTNTSWGTATKVTIRSW